MTDWRENLGWLIGSVATAVTLAIGWFFESGILNTIVGIVIGAGIAFFIQTRTQKRAWKREYSVKIAETVYGNLFNSLRGIIPALEEKRYYSVNFDDWVKMTQDHRYFMVDEKFRAKLDYFLKGVKDYASAVTRLRGTIIPEILNEETERVFDVETERHATLGVKYKEKHQNISTSPRMLDTLIYETHPKEYALRDLSETPSSVQCIIQITKRDNRTYSTPYEAKFDEYWESCLERMKSNETYQFVIKENERLLDEARGLEKEIAKRIEEPWKI